MNRAYFLVLITISFFAFSDASAARYKRYNHHITGMQKYAGLVVDADKGIILYQKNAGAVLYPASLTKMMTLYLAFKALDEDKISMDDRLDVSSKAARMPRTNLRLIAGQNISTREAILGVIVHSANDAAVILAETLEGTEEAFAIKMTRIARQIGMKDTVFRNAHGLPDSEQVTTALDMAKLAIALKRDFPHYYPLFSIKSFKFRGRIINTHNRVMHRYPWADGLKTGFTNASGFNLVTSTNRTDGRLVGVVLGGPTASARDTHMIQLLEAGYRKLNELGNSKSEITTEFAEHMDVFEVANASQNYANPIATTNDIANAKKVTAVKFHNKHSTEFINENKKSVSPNAIKISYQVKKHKKKLPSHSKHIKFYKKKKPKK